VALVARASTAAEFVRYVQGNREEMHAVAERIAATTGDRLLVTNTNGRVILDSSDQLFGQKVHPMSATVDVIFVARSQEPADGKLFTQKLADAPQPLVGKLAPIMGMPAINNAPLLEREQGFVSAVSGSLLVGVLVGGVVAVGLTLFFARGILQPVGALTLAAQRMERGDLSQRVRVSSRDEIGQLASAFNAMADGLARTDQLRRAMVTDVAHELRTPLTNLRGYLEAVRDGVAEPRREVIDSLYEEAMLLSHLVDDLQDLTLSEAGQLTLHREPISPEAVLTVAAQAVQPRADEKRISLQVEATSDLPMVEADPQRLGQILRNLLANSLTHTPDGGAIRMAASRTGDEVAIEVQDTGSGIEPQHLPNVFERFYRADPSRTRATGGTGIGLAVVKHLVEAHGGAVAVTSAPGQGSLFRFTLPVS
jgi:signal transduction histidine kinase